MVANNLAPGVTWSTRSASVTSSTRNEDVPVLIRGKYLQLVIWRFSVWTWCKMQVHRDVSHKQRACKQWAYRYMWYIVKSYHGHALLVIYICHCHTQLAFSINKSAYKMGCPFFHKCLCPELPRNEAVMRSSVDGAQNIIDPVYHHITRMATPTVTFVTLSCVKRSELCVVNLKCCLIHVL